MSMKSGPPAPVPDQYRAIVLEFVRETFARDAEHLRSQFGITLDPEDVPRLDDEFLELPIARVLAFLAQAAAGQTRGLDRRDMDQRIQDLVRRLAVPPDEFWASPIGAMVALAQVWARGDRLLTISEAAELSGKSVKSISQFVARGKLTAYPDLNEPNPRRRMRVLKSDVQALR